MTRPPCRPHISRPRNHTQSGLDAPLQFKSGPRRNSPSPKTPQPAAATVRFCRPAAIPSAHPNHHAARPSTTATAPRILRGPLIRYASVRPPQPPPPQSPLSRLQTKSTVRGTSNNRFRIAYTIRMLTRFRVEAPLCDSTRVPRHVLEPECFGAAHALETHLERQVADRGPALAPSF